MEPTHFESLYPPASREAEIKQILDYIRSGSSVQLTGLPGVGRSTVLELLSYNTGVRKHRLGENQQWFHFVLLNCREVKGRSLFDLTKFIFLSIADSLRDRNLAAEHDRVHKIFNEHSSSQDEVVLFQGLKEALDFLTLEKELTIILMFDRFEEYIPSVTPDFFQRLRVLRDRAKYRFSVIFSTPRPLEDLVEASVMEPFSEFLNGNIIQLALWDKPSLEFRIAYLEKTRDKNIEKTSLETIYKLTGGHGKLTQIAVEEVLYRDVILIPPGREKDPGSKDRDSSPTAQNDTGKFLLDLKPIQRALFEIWNFLTPSEQENHASLGIPLLSDFVEQKSLMQEITQGKIEYNEQSNTITKGHVILSDALTSLEFKLLKQLIANHEKIIERGELIASVWEDAKSTAGVTDQALDQLIFRLRKKIETDPNNPIHLLTVKGRGFKFTP